MAPLAAVLSFVLLSSAVAWNLETRCPAALNTGSVGSCAIFGCSPSRGPTHCTLGGCFCNAGYCRYPPGLHIQARYCVARIPGKTCHLSRFCWSGGMTNSMCDSGLCMCKFGLQPVQRVDNYGQWDGTYDCEPEFGVLASAVAKNSTQEEITTLLEHQEHSDRMVTYNMLIGVAWMIAGTVFVAALIAGVVVSRRAKKVEVESYNPLMG